jgi:hypothetical protein
MTIPGRTRVLAALGAAVALTLSAPAHASAPTSSKAPAKPVVGECRHLSLKQSGAETDTSAPIDCKKNHNARVIAVKNLPNGATYDHLSQAKLFHYADQICHAAVRKAVARNHLVLDQTAYTYLFFQPTAAQQAQGARWVRCDLAIVHGHVYGNLPTDKTPAVKGRHIPNSARKCLAGKSRYTTTCSAGHLFRATGAFTVPGKKFPGTKAIEKLANKRCLAHVSSRDFMFTWKNQPYYTWRNDHTVVCYSKTSH